MHLVFFGNAPAKNAAIRSRVLKWADLLQDQGHTCTVCLPASIGQWERWYEQGHVVQKILHHGTVLVRRLLQLRHVRKADVILFRGPLLDYGPPILERMIRWLNPRMIFDIDDALWEPAEQVDSPFSSLVDFRWTEKMARICRHAIVGNTYLAEAIRPMLDQVTIIPTCIDEETHIPKPMHELATGKPVRLGWAGQRNNLGHLDLIASALQALAREHTLELHIASNGDYTLPGVKVINHRWQLKKELNYLHGVDIGLMPLKDTPRARGKCAYKALAYMAVGVPVVVSPVGMNAEVIEDGVNGFLARTSQEWEEKLARLMNDSALRAQLGENARATILGKYIHAQYYPIFLAVLQSVAEQ